MDYEKKYKEVLEFARQLKDEYNDIEGYYPNQWICEKLFPELKESEDEKIRKQIKAFIKSSGSQITQSKTDSWIAWLEKQGEQKQPKELTNSEFVEKCKGLSRLEQYILALAPTRPIDAIKVDAKTIRYLVEQEQGEQKLLDIEIPFGAKDSELIEETYHIPDGYHAEINSNTVVIKKDEQKPVEWSEEDEKLYQSALWHIKNSCGNQGKTSGEYEVYHFVKSLKDRIQPQPKQEWSEEDETNRCKTINYINAARMYVDVERVQPEWADDCINWLKSLRPQTTWKPSEEQLRELENVFGDRSAGW